MIKVLPFAFIILWSSAFITTKPIIDNSDPFAALAFRFAIVAFGFYLFSIYKKQKLIISRKNFLESFLSGYFSMVYILGEFLLNLKRNAYWNSSINSNSSAHS